MKNNLYSIYDTKTEVYMAPVAFPNEATAMRQVSVALTKDGMMSRYPEDYDLYCVGTWDDTEGRVNPLAQVRFITKLTKLMKEEEVREPLPRG